MFTALSLGSAVVGTTDEQTLTNKTLDAPVIKNPILEGLPDGGGPGVPGDIDIEADVDMNTFKVTNMGDAVDDQDAVTKSQLDAQIDLVNGATVEAGTTTTGAAGTNASVTNRGTQNAAIFDFVIPRGDKGDEGPEGPQGDGIQIKGTVDSSANLPGSADDGDIYIATDTGHGWAWDSETNQWIDLGELRGPQGEPGPPGDLPAASAADLVLTSTGTSEGDYEWAEASGGIDVPAERKNTVLQALPTSENDDTLVWKQGMALEVVQELPPDDDDGYDIGDVVFVLGDVPKAGGGSPAAISSENGASVERGKVIGDKTYDIYTFTDDTATDLSLTVAPDGAGLAEILVVAGGGGSGNDAGAGGGGLLHQTVLLPAGPHSVAVGSGGAGGSSGLQGDYSRLGPFAVPGGGAGQNANVRDSYGGSNGGGGRSQSGSPWEHGIALYGGAYGNNAAGGTSSPSGGGGGGGCSVSR